MVGWLIDFYGSFDRVLVIVGLVFPPGADTAGAVLGRTLIEATLSIHSLLEAPSEGEPRARGDQATARSGQGWHGE